MVKQMQRQSSSSGSTTGIRSTARAKARSSLGDKDVAGGPESARAKARGSLGDKDVAAAPESARAKARGSLGDKDVAGAPESARAKARGSLGSQSASRFQGRLRDVDQLLAELVRLHEELLEVVQRKLMAMRMNDIEVIHECVAREGELTKKISDREGLRRRLVVLIGQDLGLREEESRNMSIGRLAEYLHENKRLKLQVLADRLSAVLVEIAKVNTVVTLFAGRMLEHYRYVFGEITKGISESPVYVRDGGQPKGTAAQVFDATG